MLVFGSFAFGQTKRVPKQGEIITITPTYIDPTSKATPPGSYVKWGWGSDCDGRGICGIVLSPEKLGGNGIIVTNDSALSKSKSDYMLVLEIGAPIASDIDTDLHIDKNLTIDVNGTTRTIPAGVYPLVMGKTKYGNYFVPVK
ncbi:MAG: hypothetical protein LBE36_04725 [Flavobacteriaceae bacterium]|jgi:hypothetical protein|nr:hypothetical protein [Flavobacteriaceae bacterium]